MDNNPQNVNSKHTIKFPDEISKLLEDLWINHKAGNKTPARNVFWVQLPPLSEEEKAAIEAKKEAELKASKDNDDKPKDLYGAWI